MQLSHSPRHKTYSMSWEPPFLLHQCIPKVKKWAKKVYYNQSSLWRSYSEKTWYLSQLHFLNPLWMSSSSPHAEVNVWAHPLLQLLYCRHRILTQFGWKWVVLIESCIGHSTNTARIRIHKCIVAWDNLSGESLQTTGLRPVYQYHEHTSTAKQH